MQQGEAQATLLPAASASRRHRINLATLPKWLFVIPMVVQWFWLALCHRSLTLPSAINPTITAGGMVGEGKLEYFATMGPLARAATAPFTAIVNDGPAGLPAARTALAAAGLAFPLIAKPDVGWCGFGVRLLRDESDLADYLRRFPLGQRIVLQQFLTQEGEGGLFYVRHPNEPTGRVTALLLRHYPRVVGDGVRSIAALAAGDPRLQRLGRDGLSEPCCDVTRVPTAGEIVRIATIGSTRVGGLYEEATHRITPAMSAAIDAIARDMKDFHLGRFDLRYDSLAALAQGEGFSLIEVNGAGSEAVQAWDPKYSLRQGYGIVFAKQRLIFRLGAVMRQRGHRPIGPRGLIRLHRRQQALIRRYPPSN